MTDEDEIVPLFEGAIVIKATRLPASAAKYLKSKKSSKPSPAQRTSSNPKPSQNASEHAQPRVTSPSGETKSASPVTSANFLDSFVVPTAVV